MIIKTPSPCSFPRRLAAMAYDGLLLVGLLFIATFILIPMIGGEAIESTNIFYKILLLLLSWFYFVWHWNVGGQTLGMRSWHVLIVNELQQNPDWKQGSIRFFSALLSLLLAGSGFLWALFDRQKRGLHDHVSKTRLVVRRQ